ncbi:hypothetical protein GCM10009700_17440 [Brevibacterium sanguinis]
MDDLGADIVADVELVLDPGDDLRIEGLGTVGAGNDRDLEHGCPSLSVDGERWTGDVRRRNRADAGDDDGSTDWQHA